MPQGSVNKRAKNNGYEMENREGKCILMKQIQQLDNAALAKRVFKEAEEKGWPGLHIGVKEIYSQFGIQYINKCSKTNIK